MPVYFDNNATTRLDPRVLEAMLPYLSGPYGNASSLHRYGRAARDVVETARAQIAAFIGAQPSEVIWTSGGTEANNLALKGVTDLATPSRVLYGITEHPAVMETAESLKSRGWGVEPIAVDHDGVILWDAFAAQLRCAPVKLVALMRANNETGVIQDLGDAKTLVHGAGAWLHVDAVQAAGKIPVDFSEMGCDLMSLSSHKIYGPKGIGALIVSNEVEITPLHHGGAQERGLRGGTENVAAIVGFGVAAELAGAELAARTAQTLALREKLESSLREISGIEIFGAASLRLPNTLQFALHGYDGEALLMQLDRKGIAVSSGSACASGNGEPSHVLLGMGISYETAKGAIRVSFGKDNTEAEVEQFLTALKAVAQSR
ncbi:cysteine desulfurase family protein [Stenotrophobium rhamnosiphilum]|uniref:cysteine desulfurase n=1 Tax=Stenotrophobium rhamnosiphilum TaxID=2029166 RepID=A0A2T5MIG3_9GAMM|nr:cysteine desulfurase family protein [Stenotrophobium rhamnosiphilum]PTU32350.1 cysteine desulfurase [Stenotrophobium rhamnosiphilum]